MPCAMHWNALRCDVIQCICAHVYSCTVLGIFFKGTIAKGQDNVCCDILKNRKEKIAHPPNFPHHCVGNPNSKIYQFRIATVEASSKNHSGGFHIQFSGLHMVLMRYGSAFLLLVGPLSLDILSYPTIIGCIIASPFCLYHVQKKSMYMIKKMATLW